MLVIEKRLKLFGFKEVTFKEVWFAPSLFDVDGCDVLRFLACRSNATLNGFALIKRRPTSIIDLTRSLDAIWRGMDKGSCRWSIKRAQRQGVRIRVNERYEDFFAMDRAFRERKGLPAPDFLTLEAVKKHGTLFTVEFDGEILAAQAYLQDEETIRWLIGASKRLQVDSETVSLIGNATKLAIWRAIQYAKEMGLKQFDFGGLVMDRNSPLFGIDKFKLSFGGEIVNRYEYRKDYSQLCRLYHRLKPMLHFAVPKNN